jgi:hypothetical protein
MVVITGPKAADIDLFGSEDEFEELDEDFLNQRPNQPEDGPLMTAVSSTTTVRPAATSLLDGSEPRSGKVLVEEVAAAATTSVSGSSGTASGSGQKTRLMIEEVDSDEESDEDDIPEEIVVAKGKKKGWVSIDEGVPDLEEVDVATGRVTDVITGGAKVAAPQKPFVGIQMIGDDDVDGLD